MYLLMTADNHLFCFTLSPDHRPAYFFVCEFDLNNLDSGENLQEHKARAGEMVRVNELYFRLMCLILSFPLVTVTVMFLLSLLLNSIMVSCEASTERDSNMQHLDYFPRAHAP